MKRLSALAAVPPAALSVPDEVVRVYLMGGCARMAWALSQLADMPVGLIRAERVLGGGAREQVADVIHAFVWASGEQLGDPLVADIKGVRPLAEMLADFEWLKQHLQLPGVVAIEFQSERLDSADELFCGVGFDPSGVERALADARRYLQDHFAMQGFAFSASDRAECAAVCLLDDQDFSMD